MQRAPSSRILSADIIRVVAMLMVVALHTILNFAQRPDFFATKLWFLVEPVVILSKTCVLLFFMLSGYLVIHKKRSLKENWQKTFTKIIIPLLFFSLINIGVNYEHFTYDASTGITFFQSQLTRVTSFPSSPLWFLIVLIFMYLLNPIWQEIFDKDRDKNLALYITGLTFAFALLTTVIKFPSYRNGTFFNVFTGWTGYLFFYLYGGLIRNKWLSSLSTKLNFILIGAGFLMTLIGDYYTLYAQIHQIPFVWTGYFFDYLSIPIVMMSIGIFNLLISSDFSHLNQSVYGKKLVRCVEWLAALSFGIYLIHPYVVTFLIDHNFDFNKAGLNVYVFNVLNYALVFGISLLITLLMKRIPKVRDLIGG